MRIGILVSAKFMKNNRSFYWSLIQEITVLALKKKSFCILEAVDREAEEEGHSPNILSGDRADGLLVIGTFRAFYEQLIVKNADIPVIFVDSRPTVAGYDAVMNDNFAGGTAMTDYLFSQGCSRIAFVGTPLMTSGIDERFFGYMRSLLGHGKGPGEAWVIPDRDPANGEIDAERFIQLPDELPDAFFCNCDVTAQILIEKLRAAGHRVPEDVLVAGFDDYLDEGDEEGAGITTYAVDRKGMAEKAVHMILHKIESPYSYGLVSVRGSMRKRRSA